MVTTFIYALICPISGDVRYIGKSIRPKERLQNHMNDRSQCHRSHWLQSLKKSGMKPSICIIDEFDDGVDWAEAERYWIASAKYAGCSLTNNTSGGDGVRDLHPSAKERIAKAWIGRKHSSESIKRIGDASRGRHHSEDHKRRMSEKMAERKITWGAKIAVSVRKLTQDDVANISAALARGERNKDLAEKYGVHRTTLSKIKAGRYFVK